MRRSFGCMHQTIEGFGLSCMYTDINIYTGTCYLSTLGPRLYITVELIKLQLYASAN